METKNKKFDMMYVHIAVMMGLIIGFHFVPPVGSITTVGMKLVGIFLAMLYGWTTCGMLWPSIIGLLAVPFSGAITMKEFVMSSFGNETVVYILFLFIFTAVIETVGLIEYIANKMISFKFLNNRPWAFSAFLLIGAYLSSAFINMFASIFVFWGIIYIVAKQFDFKPYEKYPTLMILGVTLASGIGGSVMPYKPITIVILSAYSAAAGVPMDFFKYICFSLPVSFVVMLFYVFLCRFVFRPDIKTLPQISVDFADPDALILDKKQKMAIAFLGVFIFFMGAPSMLPASWGLTIFLKSLGNAGCLLALLVFMQWVKVDGEKFLNFYAMAKHIDWNIYLTMAFIIPFAAIFTGEGTGVKETIIQVLQPFLSSLSPIPFLILTLFIATVLTNFANNMVIGAVFATLIVTIGGGLNLDTAPMIAVLAICVNLAMATPAASPMAAVTFANTEWCKAKDIYKYALLTVLFGFIFLTIVGLAWATIVY